MHIKVYVVGTLNFYFIFGGCSYYLRNGWPDFDATFTATDVNM